VVIIETLFYGKVFSQKTQLSLLPVCIGVFLTSATDVQFNMIGTTKFFLQRTTLDILANDLFPFIQAQFMLSWA